MSGNSELFGDLPEQLVPQAPGRGMPRLRQPERHQLGWYAATIDDLVARDHPVRAVWAFVQGLDLRALHDAVKAREGVPGQAPPAPELMMALWLWATVEGVGSARQLNAPAARAALLAYRWAVRGVSTELRHAVGFPRGACRGARPKSPAGGAATLVAQGLVALDVPRRTGSGYARRGAWLASARRDGWASWRRRPPRGSRGCAPSWKLDPAAGDRRQQAAQQRAARERVGAGAGGARPDEASWRPSARVREKTNKAEVSRQKEPRASTTDAQARTMKLADGGFRPAYNMQIVSAPRGQVIVAVDIDTTGSDRGSARPALEQLSAAGTTPSDYLVDGGFAKNDDIERAHASGIALWCPPVHSKHGSDPYASRADDKPGVADWRQRMASEPGKALYKQRAKAECPTLGRAAWGSAGCRCAAKRRPAPCCCGSRSPTTCCGRSYCSRPPGPLQLEIVQNTSTQ